MSSKHRRLPLITARQPMGRQHGAQLGISIAALDMAPASTRSQATSKVLTEAGTSAVNGAHAYGLKAY